MEGVREEWKGRGRRGRVEGGEEGERKERKGCLLR